MDGRPLISTGGHYAGPMDESWAKEALRMPTEALNTRVTPRFAAGFQEEDRKRKRFLSSDVTYYGATHTERERECA